MQPATASRIADLKPEGAYAVLAQARELEVQGREIIHLEIGEPDFATPAHITLAGVQALASGRTRYNPPAGLPELRRALAEDAGRWRDTRFTPDQVVVAPGAKPIIFLAMQALLEPGDEVICPDPGFPTYEAAVVLAGGVPVRVPLLEVQGFDLDVAELRRRVGGRTRLIILNSPANPTGGVLSSETLAQVAAIARENDCWVFSDEIYARLCYDGSAPSIATQPEMAARTVILDGFSKTYAMTGWRLGYGIMPADLAARMGLLLTHSVGCTATFTQLAGTAAVTGSQEAASAMRERFRRRRDVMVDGLNAIPGIHCHLPRGAFYAFPNVTRLGPDAEALAAFLLETAGVALLPGTSFGPGGQGYLRLSYATSTATIRAALERIAAAVATL